jgi:hypothetical protein
VRGADADGRAVVAVPLANEAGTAIVDAGDYDRLEALGLSPSWYLNGADRSRCYVRAAINDGRGNNVAVARIIVDAGPGQIVRYRDGDTTNLRRDNLLVRRGQSKRTDARLVAAAVAGPSADASADASGQPERRVSDATAADLRALVEPVLAALMARCEAALDAGERGTEWRSPLSEFHLKASAGA